MFVEREDITKLKNQNKKLRKMYIAERQKVEGHEELTKIQSAYIAILLKKLGATEESPVTITNEEVKKAMERDEVRIGLANKGVWKFYIEEAEK